MYDGLCWRCFFLFFDVWIFFDSGTASLLLLLLQPIALGRFLLCRLNNFASIAVHRLGPFRLEMIKAYVAQIDEPSSGMHSYSD